MARKERKGRKENLCALCVLCVQKFLEIEETYFGTVAAFNFLVCCNIKSILPSLLNLQLSWTPIESTFPARSVVTSFPQILTQFSFLSVLLTGRTAVISG